VAVVPIAPQLPAALIASAGFPAAPVITNGVVAQDSENEDDSDDDAPQITAVQA
jgi:hypothetical protein